ncbi:hypothetical protein JOC78_003185 [Bacillus ectoiniformans]|nr:hypothetical protein [Bacillus ectoiniformans]
MERGSIVHLSALILLLVAKVESVQTFGEMPENLHYPPFLLK